MKIYAVTAIDVGDNENGHAELIGSFQTREGAKRFITACMEDMRAKSASSFFESDGESELWTTPYHTEGCIFDIHELDTAAIDSETESETLDAKSE